MLIIRLLTLLVLTLQLPVALGADKSLQISIGAGKLIQLPRAAKTVFLANPDVADVKAPTPTRIFVTGKAAGVTSLYALDHSSNVILEREIQISYNITALEHLIQKRFPQSEVTFVAAPGSLMVEGAVESQQEHDAIVKTIERYTGLKEGIIDQLEVTTPSQVNLKVRVVELSKSVDQQFGVNWQTILNTSDFTVALFNGRQFLNSTGALSTNTTQGFFGGMGLQYNSSDGRVNLNGVIDALEKESLVNVLAEPNLTAMSGKKASFLVGGEFPIATAGGSGSSVATSIDFRSYGVGLEFTPTIKSKDRISVNIKPEISQLSFTNGITRDGFQVPGLDVRRLETTVEIVNGQSFALGGLLYNTGTDSINAFPGLGKLPILGKLFSSTAYQNRQTELVIIVTPEIVQTRRFVAQSKASNSLRAPSGLEFIFANRLKGRKPGEYRSGVYLPETLRLGGPSGFVY